MKEIEAQRRDRPRFRWCEMIPFLLIQAGCFGVFFVGVSWVAIAIAVALYVTRMLLITGFYHRYFSHRSFKTSRLLQFVAAFAGCTACQRGPLWWAAHHRLHHFQSDREGDVHSPVTNSFLWSHILWFMTVDNFHTRHELIRDWRRYSELVMLENWCVVPAALLPVGLFIAGVFLEIFVPESGTNGPQLVVWGFSVSTTCLYHATFSINSFAHRFGVQRYETNDSSRNNMLLALITLGEGWHNNHHRYPAIAHQGIRWWEVDLTYYFILLLQKCKLVWGINSLPRSKVRDT